MSVSYDGYLDYECILRWLFRLWVYLMMVILTMSVSYDGYLDYECIL